MLMMAAVTQGTKTKADCRKAAESLMMAQAKASGANMDKGQMDAMLRDAGKEAAGKKIATCVASATTAAAKAACVTGAEAKAAFAAGSGRDASKIKDVDLKAAAQETARKNMKKSFD